MNVLALHLDDALLEQPRFLNACHALGCSQTDLRSEASDIRLWGYRDAIDRLGNRLGSRLFDCGRFGPRVAFLGSGDFHHVAASLIGIAAEWFDEPFTVIHFDRHPDWVKFDGGVHCGSWVNEALSDPRITRVITVGVGGSDLRLPEIKGANLAHVLEARHCVLTSEDCSSLVFKSYGTGPCHHQFGRLISWRRAPIADASELADDLTPLIDGQPIYVTIDKDVLTRSDALTNWDQGEMSLSTLLGVLSRLLVRHRVVGIDVCGDYSTPHYGGGAFQAAAKSLEAMIDQPQRRAARATAAAINESANIALLNLFAEAM